MGAQRDAENTPHLSLTELEKVKVFGLDRPAYPRHTHPGRTYLDPADDRECDGSDEATCPWLQELMHHWTGADILLTAADRHPLSFSVNDGEEKAIRIIMATGGPNEVRERMLA